MSSHAQNYVMLCNILAVFRLCSPLALKQVGTPCWGRWWWETCKGTGATMGAMLGTGATTWDMQIDMQLAACVTCLPTNKGMPDIPTAPWIFFRLHEYHEPVGPWRVATHQTSIQFNFLAVLVVFVFKLVVILLLVVWGNEAYLPTPPSWLKPQLSPNVYIFNKKNIRI